MARTITIDPAGRLVIPKAIRDRYGLHAGSEVEIVAEGERIVIEPVTREATVIEREGMLVITSELVGEPSDQQSMREERLNRLAGNES